MAKTLSDVAEETLLYLEGFGLQQSRSAWLTDDVSESDVQFKLDANGPVSEGLAEVDDELVYLRKWDSSVSTATVAPDGRGWRGTTAKPHLANARVRLQPTFPKVAVAQAINSAIGQVFPMVWGVGFVTLDYNPAVNTFQLPKDAEGVLAVSTDTYGPTGEWLPVNDYRFDSGAAEDEYTSGNTITIYCGLLPGRKFKVAYMKRPTELDSMEATLADAGLSDHMSTALTMGAASHLVQFLDMARLPTDSAQAHEMDNHKTLGRATELSGTMYQRFLMECTYEQKRLRKQYPQKVRRVRR